jgi:hypothetical protein
MASNLYITFVEIQKDIIIFGIKFTDFGHSGVRWAEIAPLADILTVLRSRKSAKNGKSYLQNVVSTTSFDQVTSLQVKCKDFLIIM